MAGILDRFTSIIKANINDLLDKAEDPAKMVDQYMRELTESLAEVREATAGVMAEETRCKRMMDENAGEIAKYDGLARKALEGAMSAFNRMESKADEMLDKSNAMAELNAQPKDTADDLAKKYEEAGSTAAVDDELAKMKAEMGLN